MKLFKYVLITVLFAILPVQKVVAQDALDIVSSTNDTLLHVQDDGKVSIGGSTPSFSLDVAGKIGINDTQVLYLPDQTTFTGSIFIGNGGANLAGIARFNTAVGIEALKDLTTGLYNTANGYEALRSNTTGIANTANGYQALKSNTSGRLSTANGYGALTSNTTGESNTAIGSSALTVNTTGNDNVAIGTSANYWNEGGSRNTIIGLQAGRGNGLHDKSGNIFLGYQAGYNETGDDKLYIENSNSATPLIGGDFAADELYFNGKVGISDNTPTHALDVAGKIGINDIQMLYLPDQTDFVGSLIVGDGGTNLIHTTGAEGRFNTILGVTALRDVTTGNSNTASGYATLQKNMTGNYNTANGHAVLQNSTTGNSNTGMGAFANISNTTGSSNTSIGRSANAFNQAGSNNTIIGVYAGEGTVAHDKSGNVFVGYSAGRFETGNNKLYIENSNSATPLIGGDFAVDELYFNGMVGIGTGASPASQLEVAGTVHSTTGGFKFPDGTTQTTAASAGGGFWTQSASDIYYTIGNVGIGDNTPTHALDVAGKIGINDTQILYLPDQTDFVGSLIIGNGGANLNHISATDGYYNTAVGVDALKTVRFGYYNVAIGSGALFLNKDGYGNTAIGTNALFSNIDGINNTASGNNALSNSDGGGDNTASGNGALRFNTTGNYNTGIGSNANYWNQTGSRNTIIGYNAGRSTAFHNKSGNIFLGYEAGYNELGDDKLYIENSNSATPLIGGDFAADKLYLNGRVGIGTGSSLIPQAKLQVISNNRHAGYFTSDSLAFETEVIHAEYTGSNGSKNVTAIYGKAVPTTGFGTGGLFVGGWQGAVGRADVAGSGERYGVRGFGENSTGFNYGVYGEATSGTTTFGVYGTGSLASGTNYGVRGVASDGTDAYGIYGSASGASSTNYAVYASGDLGYTGALVNASDAKLKENVRPIANALANIRQLNGRRYNFTEQSQYASLNLAEGAHYGLIAQEVEQVLPDLVVDATHPGAINSDTKKTAGSIEYKGVKYLELIPLLIEGMKEQQDMIEEQSARIERLEALVVKLQQ